MFGAYDSELGLGHWASLKTENDDITPRPRKLTRGNRHMSLSESQFPKTQSRTRKVSGTLARSKNGTPTQSNRQAKIKKFS